MSAPGDIYIGEVGQVILISPFGRKYNEQNIELSRTQRAASGKLHKEIIAIKKKIVLTWNLIDGSEYQKLYDLSLTETVKNLIAWQDRGQVLNIMVHLGPVQYTRLLIGSGTANDGLYEDVTLEMDEE